MPRADRPSPSRFPSEEILLKFFFFIPCFTILNPAMIKALVVDDETDMEYLFRQKFRKEIRTGEFDFHFAFSGEEAITYLSALNPVDIVLVLSDINMPGMSGFELLKIIKERFSHLKVVMVTAYGDAENKENSARLGADGFVNKPVNFDELKTVISSLSIS